MSMLDVLLSALNLRSGDKPADDPYAGWSMRQGPDGTWMEQPPTERSASARALMAARDAVPENPSTQWSAANILRGALERSANLQDVVGGYRDPKGADPLDLVPMLAPGAIAGAMRGPARSTLMSAGGVPPKDPPGFTAFHGSPHEFDRFSMDKIGTGEGAQAYGHGLYFADAEATARSYREALTGNHMGDQFVPAVDGKHVPDASPVLKAILQQHRTPEAFIDAMKPRLESARKKVASADKDDSMGLGFTDHDLASMDLRKVEQQIAEAQSYIGRNLEMKPPGHMYEVRIKADPADFLDWDKPLKDQSGSVQERFPAAIRSLAGRDVDPGSFASSGSGLQNFVSAWSSHDPVRASTALREAGIPGTRYLDQGSRTGKDGTRNTVVFDDKLIEIIRKYGLAGAIMSGALSQGGDDGSSP